MSPARENRSPYEGAATTISSSPGKRSSIENLKKASRVKNSGIFAIEQNHHYDPARPAILDGKPIPNNRSSEIRSSDVLRKENVAPTPPLPAQPVQIQEDYTASMPVAPLSPSKMNASPVKSSLSKRTGVNFRHSAFDPETGIWADEDEEDKRLPEGRSLHRHAKSVTFDHGPPQVNEYEMATPDPSSVASGSREGSYDSVDDDEELSFERGSSMDHEDSFDASLEDTDKTPVVLPEDWRHMSPAAARTELAQYEEDVFDDEYGSPAPTANPGPLSFRPHQTSVNSVDSNGQARPLPPLPPAMASPQKHSPNRDSLSGTFERMSGSARNLPLPPVMPAVSKSDIRRMSGSSFSLDDRLRLMMANDNPQPQQPIDDQRERRMRRVGAKDQSPLRSSQESDEDVSGEPGPEIVDDSAPAPRISRESIIRHMRSQNDLQSRAGSEESETTSRASAYDPDVPIPSMEDPTVARQVVIKEEEVDEIDLYSIPGPCSRASDLESDVDDDLPSQYSQPSVPSFPISQTEDGQDTPRAHSPARDQSKQSLTNERMSLPDIFDFGDESSFNMGLETYMTPPSNPQSQKSSLESQPEVQDLPDLAALRTSIQRPYTPQEQLEPPRKSWETNEPGTPDSVIRHPTQPEDSLSPPPEVPKKDVTVKAHENNLKTRPSLTRADVETVQQNLGDMSLNVPAAHPGADETTTAPLLEAPADNVTKPRVSSLVQLQIPEASTDGGLSFGLEKEFDRVVEAQKVEFERSLHRLYYPFNGRFPSSEMPDSRDMRIQGPLQDIPYFPRPHGARPVPLSPIDESFANRSPFRQRGYLMRQNTKVVVATERASHEEPRVPELAPPVSQDGQLAVPSFEPNEVIASPRKTSQPTWTAEPWNGRSRRKSIRVGGEKSPSKRKAMEGPAPPMPGQVSNVQDGLGAVAEDELAEEEAEEFEDGAERGRLFVKVIGVKDLRLPFPKSKSELHCGLNTTDNTSDERSQFALTLDNGLHCVTTAWLDLAKDAPIGQEFELVVLNELEFQLTLQMKLEEPKVERPSSPTKPPSSPSKQNVFGRLFGSPKKRKEEAKTHSAAQRRPITPPSAYELVQGLVAKDGSFARAYIAMSEHEKEAYGRPYSVDITCFNEWAMEEVNVGSSRSKKSVTQLQRRPPYEIGKLELLLLYVPKPKGAKDEDMPKSMNSAVRVLREAEERMQQQASIKEFEGHLSQQGGDCPYWRRRFFKLVGPKLTAYHESTLQPRATINLAKASKLIDDKSALTKKETTTRGGGRRKSAFAEEEEGYMFVEEGFRIRFANGEVIDFYADSPAQKEEWMKALSQVVGKGIPAASSSSSQAKGWTEMVLKREKSTQSKQKQSKPEVPDRGSSRDQPPQPQHHGHQAPPQSPTKQEYTRIGASGIPLPTRPAPTPRASAGNMRTESYQPEGSSRSQAGSPVKARTSVQERHRKTKSMLM